MKKLMFKINMAIIAMMVSVPAFAAATRGTAGGESAVCDLIDKLKGIFVVLRTLAFVGAAFYIAAWAWDFISKGKADPKDLKEKGIGLLVGFIMLFSIGVLLSFILGATNSENGIWCQSNLTSGW